MAKEYLDKSGLTYLWGKLKGYFQEKLISGTNIKTINNTSLLGSGNITISGGGGSSYTATLPIDITDNNISLEESGVTAGTYGSYTSSTPSYYVPSVTVDEHGIVTSASQSLLSYATRKQNGILKMADFNYFAYNETGYATGTVTCGMGMSSGNVSLTQANLIYSTVYFPQVLNAYVYCKTSSSSDTKRWVNADWNTLGSSAQSNSSSVSVFVPEKYLSYNYDDDVTTSLPCVVVYKRNYTAYASSM